MKLITSSQSACANERSFKCGTSKLNLPTYFVDVIDVFIALQTGIVGHLPGMLYTHTSYNYILSTADGHLILL